MHIKIHTVVKLWALSLLFCSSAAFAQSSIISPAPGSTLSGSSDIFKWDKIPNATKYSLWLGNSDDPDAYGRHNSRNKYSTEMPVVRLPTDGSEVNALLRWHDGNRWKSEPAVSYTAGFAQKGIFGDCTSTSDWGRVAGLLPEYFIVDESYPRGRISRSQNPRINRLLRDGCASDKDYTVLSNFSIYVGKEEKGAYLWLAPGSGAAVVNLEKWTQGTVASRLSMILPYTDVAKPFYLALEKEATWRTYITPLDPAKPVRVSEVRIAQGADDVSTLRKLRFSDSNTFIAANGDPRARVTAELNELFGAEFVGETGNVPNHLSCGNASFIDATWEIDQGVAVQGINTIWINFELATNAEISAAVKASIDEGERILESGIFFGSCTRAPDSLIYQDWLGKASDALNGNYNGPEIASDLCKHPTVGRAFGQWSFSKVDDYNFNPRKLVDGCTVDSSTWSGKKGSSVTYDAGRIRAHKGIYLWSVKHGLANGRQQLLKPAVVPSTSRLTRGLRVISV